METWDYVKISEIRVGEKHISQESQMKFRWLLRSFTIYKQNKKTLPQFFVLRHSFFVFLSRKWVTVSFCVFLWKNIGNWCSLEWFQPGLWFFCFLIHSFHWLQLSDWVGDDAYFDVFKKVKNSWESPATMGLEMFQIQSKVSSSLFWNKAAKTW